MYKYGDYVEAPLARWKTDGSLCWARVMYIEVKDNLHVVSFDPDARDRIVTQVRVPSNNG